MKRILIQQMKYAFALLLITAVARAEKRSLEVKAVSHSVSQYAYEVTSPGRTNTNCSGGTVAIGGTTTGTANCQTVSSPPVTHERAVVFVQQIVESSGIRYTLTCTARWIWNRCTDLKDGDWFAATIKGTTMSINGREGGNMGPKIRIKYRIVDMRPTERKEDKK